MVNDYFLCMRESNHNRNLTDNVILTSHFAEKGTEAQKSLYVNEQTGKNR